MKILKLLILLIFIALNTYGVEIYCPAFTYYIDGLVNFTTNPTVKEVQITTVTNIIEIQNTNEFTALTLNDVTITNWNQIGGGGSSKQVRISTNAVENINENDSIIFMDSDTAQTNQVLNLQNLNNTEFLTVVIRHLGTDFNTSVIRVDNGVTNEYTLTGDGAPLTVDWIGAKSNWYWRLY